MECKEDELSPFTSVFLGSGPKGMGSLWRMDGGGSTERDMIVGHCLILG